MACSCVRCSTAAASGDRDPDDNRLGTVNAMYPRGNYFGDEATPGPRNFLNIHPALLLQPTPHIEVNVSLDLFWRYSVNDGVHAPDGTMIRAPENSNARHVATIASFSANWILSPGLTASMVFAYSAA